MADNSLARRYHWDSESIFDTATDYFQQLLLDISLARKSIILEAYIFEKDQIGNQMIAALSRAADRGIKIKVLIDGVGSFQDCRNIADELGRHGAEVKIFHPLPWRVDLYHLAISSKSWYAKLPYFFMRLNRRDHRKLCVIDSDVAWIGSFNITDTHLPVDLGGKNLSDIGVRVEGHRVVNLEDDFHQIWFDRINEGKIKRFKYYLSNSSRAKRLLRNRFLIEKIRQARRRICIFSAYFAPSRELFDALLYARGNNVKVEVLVAEKSDVAFFTAVTATYYQRLLDNDIGVYEYTPGVLHRKTILIDKVCYLGSSNMNHRSYFHDLELDVLLTHPDSIAYFDHRFSEDIAVAKQITRQSIKAIPWYKKLLGQWLLLFKNWL